eukprot:5619817-Ditylum_brightwellii.AAC.1
MMEVGISSIGFSEINLDILSPNVQKIIQDTAKNIFQQSSIGLISSSIPIKQWYKVGRVM